ncbi:hypothetical protein [Cryptosporangium japonicum]|uniref:Uncharacterized protein n=1 Tax=Cryptosporangium japonicum TaxID=80872 RepID=A0ABN0UD83_9ACTN
MAERTVDTVLVRWYERPAQSGTIAERWLRAAAEHLPEAMPRRYGDVEPLRGRGTDGFVEAFGRAPDLFFLVGSPPVHHASLTARGGPTSVHTLQAELPADDERVNAFALALVHPGMTYVSASIERGLTLDRGTLWGPAPSPGEPYLAPRGEWLGLPPEPPVWCWFGPDYRREVARDVDGVDVAGGLLRTGGPWVHPSLCARPAEIDPSRRRAPRMPAGPRPSLWQRLRKR